MATRNAIWNGDPEIRLLAIEDLEEARSITLNQMKEVQGKGKEDHDKRLPANHGMKVGGLVLLYDSRYKNFLGNLHTRWMGPYRVRSLFANGNIQLEDLQGKWLDTRLIKSRVKKYELDLDSDDEGDDVRGDSHI